MSFLENEMAIIGAILLEPTCLDEIIQIVSLEDFQDARCHDVFDACLSLADNSTPIDHITIPDACSIKSSFLDECVDIIPTAAAVGHYAKEVKENSTIRRLSSAAHDIIQYARDGKSSSELLEMAESSIMSVRTDPKSGPSHAKTALKDILNEMEWYASNPGKIPGIPTGIKQLDTWTAGLMNSDLIIVGARPSIGKTAFAVNIMENMSVRGNMKGLFFSLEMSKKQIVQRAACSLARVNGSKAKIGRLDKAEFSKLTEAMNAINSSNLWIDDTPSLHISEIKSRARRLHRKENLDYICLDYIGLARGDGDNRVQQVGSITKGLKSLAKEINVPAIALSQLNRGLESRADKRPVLSDLRESGDIEQDADLILFIHREKKEQTEPAELIIAKQRNGPLGIVNMTFRGEHTRFSETTNV